jgi:hypothetical protein
VGWPIANSHLMFVLLEGTDAALANPTRRIVTTF